MKPAHFATAASFPPVTNAGDHARIRAELNHLHQQLESIRDTVRQSRQILARADEMLALARKLG